MANWFEQELAQVAGGLVDSFGWASKEASALVINKAVNATPNRPHPWSTATDYTSWEGLFDKTYLARHLPPVAALPASLPNEAAVEELFRRPGGQQKLSTKSTCLFPAFAQYLTDGFIRTSPADPARTTSNHEIDMCPLYGLNAAQTSVLRANDNTAGRRGRLKSQMIGDEEFAPFLYLDDGTRPDPQFAALNVPLGINGPPPVPAARLKTLFAFGGDRANSTPFAAMMNTLWLREHNRIAATLEQQNPGWDDERVFQTARNIVIPIFIKIVIEQYINHITPLPFKLVCDPSVAWHADWNRPNWMTAEFSLLYRWHSLMPDAIHWPGGDIALWNFGLVNTPLLQVGLDEAFSAAAAQPTAALGALNTADALLPIESMAVRQARANRLQPYNAYRVAFGMTPAAKFTDISTDPAVLTALQKLYATPDDVEFYPGLFAEDRVANAPLPGLILTMVAVDAFSQALTNPLLSEHVFNMATFTEWGFDLIGNTSSLEDVLSRNVAHRGSQAMTMTQPGWRPGA
jgi:prostaglandin-endoperoxide synthase 2